MVYAFIGEIICIVFAVIGLKNEKNIINPLTVFCAVFATVLFCSMLHLYTMFIPSNNTYKTFLLGIVYFILGYFLFEKLKYFKQIKENKKEEVKIPRYEVLYTICIICSIFFLVNLIIVINNVGSFSLYSVQKMLQGGEVDFGYPAIIRAIILLIIYPCATAIPAITATDFWFGRKDKKLILFTIIMMILRMLSTASRSGLIVIVIYIAVVGMLSIYVQKRKNSNQKLDNDLKKKKKTIIFFLGVGAIIFLIMTISRNAQILRNLYLNFAMPPVMFERWSMYIDRNEIIGAGEASLNGIFYPIFYILKNGLNIPMPEHFKSIYDAIMLTDTVWQPIGTKLTANAYVSLFWFFYVDGRALGVAIGSFIFGIICRKIYTQTITNPNAKNVCIFCLIFYSYLYSFIRMQFAMISYSLALIYILTFFYKEKNVKKSEQQPKKLKVLFIENAGLMSAGAFHSLVALAELLKYEHDVEPIIVLPDKADGINILKEKKIQYIALRSCSYSQMISNNASLVEKIKMPIKDIIVRLSAIQLAKFVKENNIQIIHENTSACYIGKYVSKLTGVKHIWHIREFMEEDFNAHLWNRKSAVKALQNADAVIAISKAIYNKYEKYLNNMICIYNGVDADKFYDENKEILNKDNLHIVSVGRICKGKGQKTLVDAVAILKNKYGIEANVILAGSYKEDDYYKSIIETIKENKLEDLIELIGQCNNIKDIYKDSDIFCMTSKCEAFGRVTVEAMMAGCLVVGGNSGGTVEIIDDNKTGIIFESDNADDLAEKLYYVAKNKEKVKEICKNGQKSAVERFTAKRNADEIYNEYLRILNYSK